jgi:hypothetical protein
VREWFLFDDHLEFSLSVDDKPVGGKGHKFVISAGNVKARFEVSP